MVGVGGTRHAFAVWVFVARFCEKASRTDQRFISQLTGKLIERKLRVGGVNCVGCL